MSEPPLPTEGSDATSTTRNTDNAMRNSSEEEEEARKRNTAAAAAQKKALERAKEPKPCRNEAEKRKRKKR